MARCPLQEENNEDKYRFINAVMMRLEIASDYFSSKNFNKTKEAIDKGKTLLIQRQSSLG